jgi:oxygen-independent coproporphyrinogen III oxidase
MPGLYIHIPFCKQACTYCDFHFSTSSTFRPELVDAIARELAFRAPQWKAQTMNTIYFGGGTPSRLAHDELDIILNSVQKHYRINPNAEFTFEANPEDLNESYLKHP